MIAVLLLLIQPAAAQTTAPAPATVEIARDEATPILGRSVLDREGQAAGRIVDVLIDGAGQVRAVVVDFGGFLGMGQRRVAVVWSALKFEQSPRSITLLLSAADIAAAPEFKPDTPANVAVTSHP